MITMRKFFLNKNIILVGPSANVLEDCKNIKVDSYDVICRLNNHWRYEGGDHKFVGTRTDVIYHCLNADQYTKKDLEFIKEKGIRFITRNEIEKTKGTPKIDRFIKINKEVNLNYSEIEQSFFDRIKKEMGCNPNTGALVIMHLLSMPIKSLTVVGFDFYETLYLHKTNAKQLEDIQKNRVAGHNPKKQLEYIKGVYKKDKRLMPIGRLKEMLDV
jgi:hypothetical protein